MLTNDSLHSLPLHVQTVLTDLIEERGLVRWHVRHSPSSQNSSPPVIAGDACLDRLQDNRLEKKRKSKSLAMSVEEGDADSRPERDRCAFVVVNTSQEPSMSIKRLLDLHAIASEAASSTSESTATTTTLAALRVFLCLTDAGTVRLKLCLANRLVVEALRSLPLVSVTWAAHNTSAPSMPPAMLPAARLMRHHALSAHTRGVTTLQFGADASTSANAKPRSRPLEGVRVIECGHLVAGPFAATILAYFGAEVIKIEPPTGDQLRGWRELDASKMSLWWYSIGRNKKSVAMDIRTPEGRELLRELVNSSDVLIENFKPGRMEKWGLGPETFEKENPGLVYTRISGYGQDGPYSTRPGFASVCEAMGGFRYVNGFPDRPPVRQNLSLGDTITGIHAALGITIALLGRERAKEKLGQVVDVAIYESMYNLMESVVPEYDYAGAIRECSGSTITGIVPSNTYVGSDGKNVVIAANTDKLFELFMKAIGRDDMAADPKFKTNPDRVKHQAEIDDAIAAWVAARTTTEVMDAMEKAGIPVGLVYSVEDMFKDPQFIHREMFEDVNIGAADGHTQTVKIPAILPKLQGTPGQTTWPGRKIGEDTRDVLQNILHRSDEQIAQLLQKEVVFEPTG